MAARVAARGPIWRSPGGCKVRGGPSAPRRHRPQPFAAGSISATPQPAGAQGAASAQLPGSMDCTVRPGLWGSRKAATAQLAVSP